MQQGYHQQPPQPGYGQPQGVNLPPVPGMPVQWMAKPNPIPGVPPGLEYLAQIEKLLVQQKIDLFEAFTGWDENNRYVIRNAAAQQVYYAFEQTDTCMRICCEAQRGFKIHVVDNFNVEVLRLSREFKCFAGNPWCAGCCDGCAHEVKVETPNGQIMGYVRQKGSFWIPKFHILDAERNPVLNIKGPCCIMNGAFCPCENAFEVQSLDGTSPVGRVVKQYGGFFQEAFTNADNFAVEFPVTLPISQKATLLGALFLVDFMYFEHKDRNESHGGIY